MLSDINRRVLVQLEADNRGLIKAIDEIEGSSKDMAKGFADAAASTSRAFDTIGLGAQNQLSRLDKLSNAFQGFTGKLGAGISAVDEFAKTLAPWNQALELGGKAINFLGDGLEAYAKTSKGAAKEVAALTKEFTDLKQSAMAAFGEVSVFALKALPTPEEMRKQMRSASQVALDAMNEYLSEGAMANRGLSYFMGGGIADDVKDMFSRDTWNTFAVDDALGRLKAGLDEAKHKTDAARESAERYRGSLRGLPGLPAGAANGLSDAINAATTGAGKFGDMIDPGPTKMPGSMKDLGLSHEDFSEFQRQIEELAHNLTESYEGSFGKGSPRGKFLEAAFGPIEEFNAYQLAAEALGGAFGSFGDAVGASYQAIVTGEGSVSAAFKRIFANSIMATGQASAVDALRETALGFGSLALGPIGGVSASAHFAAAGMHAGVAAAAGVAAKALGAGSAAQAAKSSIGSHGGSSSSSSGGSSTAGTSGGGSSGSSQTVVERIIVYGDNFADDSPRMRQLRAEELVRRALGGNGGKDD